MLIQSFIQPHEQSKVRDFILNINTKPNGATGEKSYFWRFSEIGSLIPELISIRNRCIKLIGECKQEPILEDLLVKVLPSGFVAKHTDDSPKGYKQIRANVLIQSADQGGNLIHDGNKVDWQETDVYLLDPSKHHSVTKIINGKEMLLISYGFLLRL